MGSTTVPLLVIVTGAAAVWAGIADPAGGVFSGLSQLLSGQTPAKRVGKTSTLGAAGGRITSPTGGGGGGATTGGTKVNPDVYGGYWDGTYTTIPDKKGSPVKPTPGATSKRAQVVANAGTWLGVPYAWGGTTRSGVDCSGLTQAVFATVGVKLPRVSQLQALTGKAVTQAQAKPGDLVWFGAPVHHVGIYLGNGRLRHSPRKNTVVRDERIWTWERYGFRNVLGG